VVTFLSFSFSFCSSSDSSVSVKALPKNDGVRGLPTLTTDKVGLGRGGRVGFTLSRTRFGIPPSDAGAGVGTSTDDGLFVGFFVGVLVGVTPGIIGGQSAVQTD